MNANKIKRRRGWWITRRMKRDAESFSRLRSRRFGRFIHSLLRYCERNPEPEPSPEEAAILYGTGESPPRGVLTAEGCVQIAPKRLA